MNVRPEPAPVASTGDISGSESFHRFGPFVIVRTLGRGGMGEVFLARTEWPDQPLAAVKRLRPDVARVPTFAERFHHEAALAVRLHHPNLVSTLDVGSVDGQLYVAAELVLGKDTGYIADRLRLRSQGGPAAVAVRLLLDGLAGLAYVHGAKDDGGAPLGLVHRDVTPGNLLVGYDGRARLGDFGLAKSHLSESSKLTKHGEILGTPHYLPPEVVKGEPASPGSDIYGLGAVMYRFLTGVAPFQGNTSEVLMKVLTERPRPLGELRPDLPRWLVECLERMLAPALAHRPVDAEAVAERVAASARAGELLVPRPAVGRWLAQLFEAEHREELEERDRWVREVDPRRFEAPSEGTVVLARAVASEAPIDGPSPLASAAPDEDGLGTELELSANSVLGASPPVESDQAEMPTRAVEVVGARRVLPRPASETDPNDTDLDHRRPPREGTESAEQDALDSNLTLDAADVPGFADGTDELEEGSSLPPTAPVPRGGRERTDEQLVTPVEDGSPQREPPPELLDEPEPRGATLVGELSGYGAVAPEGSEDEEEPEWRRSALLLIGLLALAVALGIGLGKVAAGLWSGGGPRAMAMEPKPMRVRLDALSRRLEARQAGGASVPPGAWRHVAQAASALLAGREAEAEAHLDAADALLERPKAPESLD